MSRICDKLTIQRAKLDSSFFRANATLQRRQAAARKKRTLAESQNLGLRGAAHCSDQQRLDGLSVRKTNQLLKLAQTARGETLRMVKKKGISSGQRRKTHVRS